MREIEWIEEAIAGLKPHWTEIETHFNQQNAHLKSLLSKDHLALGRVLKSHLIVESFLDRFLSSHLALPDLEQARLSFFQKASLLPENGSAAFVKPGILQLNKIRNQFGHELGTALRAEDLGPIRRILSLTRTKAFADPVDAVEAFTPVACAFLLVPLPSHLESLFLEAFANIQSRARAAKPDPA